MTTPPNQDPWDAIVIGAGISGLTAACALATRGRRVLVLEQHRIAGGLTQTFQRRQWTFSTGVHYLGGVGPDPGEGGHFGRLLAALTDGAMAFAPSANPYDLVRLPGFEFGIAHPEAAYREALRSRFPHEAAAIDHWFDEMAQARHAAFALLAARGMPGWMAWGLRRWNAREIGRHVHRTVADAVAGIGDPRLRAVLAARWGDYGSPPGQAPLVEHALITGAYNHGAFYPVGGPARFAQTMVPVIERAGGEVRLGADVRRIVVDAGRAGGVEVELGGRRRTEPARHVVSTMGVPATADALGDTVAPDWQAAARRLRPGLGCIALYLGFEGDIAAAGASSANVWLHESVDVGQVWRAPADVDAPGLFVSFPSLKDPSAGHAHTAEVLALCDPAIFQPWLDTPDGERPEAYLALKAWIEARLLAQFDRHFPALAPLRRFHELSTPLTQRHFVRTPSGAMYGLEMSAERIDAPVLKVRTPVPGLLLAGQDISGAGVQAAAMSGLMAAAAIDPALLRLLSG